MQPARIPHRSSNSSVHRPERGEGKLKTICYIAVIVFAIYCGVKLVPPYFANYQLSDKVQELARFAVVNRYTEEQVRDNVLRAAQELEIPMKREDIKVSASNTLVRISVNYTVPVDMFFYHTDLNFSPSSENKSLF